MEYQTVPPSLPTEQSIGYQKLNHTAPAPETHHNIFRNQKSTVSFSPLERPVGGMSTLKRIRDSYVQQSIMNYNSNCLNKATMSTKTDTLLQFQDSGNKVRTELNATTLTHLDRPKEEVLRRDIRGLSVDRIKMVNKRILTKKSSNLRPTIYQRTSQPFLDKMNKRSMSEYSQQLTKKYGNAYFEKTLRNSYQDDPAKTFIVTLFDKKQLEVRGNLRKKVNHMPFFKKHQFMEIRGEDKKEKEKKGSRTQLY